MDGADGVLFVAQTAGASCYHRIMLPALALGCDWCGLDSPPPRMVVGRGEVRSRGDEPDLGAYRIVVVQMPGQPGWLDLIPELQAGGTTVLYEVDYDMHAIEQDPNSLARIEKLVTLCDGVICATERIAERYSPLNARTFVCESGIDLQAYALTRPDHDTVNIGWSGTTLTIEEVRPWLTQIAGVMRVRDVTNFVSIGARFGDAIADLGAVAPERCLAIPPMLPEQVPAAMSHFDIVFDPAGRSRWRLGRSQLRWLEAGAWGIPLVGSPKIYPRIEHGVTGFHAADPNSTARAILRLVDDPQLRAAVGRRARRVVEGQWTMEAVAPQWERAFEQVSV
jgi:Glycosyl transferases group 1